MTTFQLAVADEDRLRVEGVDGAGRKRLAESIAEEFRAQTAVVRAACEAEMEQERAAHKLDLAQQRVTLLEGTVPLEAHEAMVESIASDFSRREEALRAQLEQRDKLLRRASSGIRAMSSSLARLKRDVASLRTALGSSDEARRVLAAEIRANEVEPERLRADAAEENLAELRQATHGWLSAGHALKLQAAEEARKSGFAEGYAEGRAELQAARAEFSEQLLRSRWEVAAARAETVELVAAAGAAGAAALTKSRDAWRAEGRAEGVEAAAAEQAAEGSSAGDGLRAAFSAYVVSAHEQKLSAVAAERRASEEAARDLSRELASANEMLAALLKERAWGTEIRRDSALDETAAAVSDAATDGLADSKLPLDSDIPGVAPWPRGAGAAVAAAAGVAAVGVAICD
eukprot:g14934.t1